MPYYDIHNLSRGTASVIEDKSKLEGFSLTEAFHEVCWVSWGVQREKVVIKINILSDLFSG